MKSKKVPDRRDFLNAYLLLIYLKSILHCRQIKSVILTSICNLKFFQTFKISHLCSVSRRIKLKYNEYTVQVAQPSLHHSSMILHSPWRIRFQFALTFTGWRHFRNSRLGGKYGRRGKWWRRSFENVEKRPRCRIRASYSATWASGRLRRVFSRLPRPTEPLASYCCRQVLVGIMILGWTKHRLSRVFMQRNATLRCRNFKVTHFYK